MLSSLHGTSVSARPEHQAHAAVGSRSFPWGPLPSQSPCPNIRRQSDGPTWEAKEVLRAYFIWSRDWGSFHVQDTPRPLDPRHPQGRGWEARGYRWRHAPTERQVHPVARSTRRARNTVYGATQTPQGGHKRSAAPCCGLCPLVSGSQALRVSPAHAA